MGFNIFFPSPNSTGREMNLDGFCKSAVQVLSVCFSSYTERRLCPALCDPMNCSQPGASCPCDSPGKDAGVGCHTLGDLPDPGIKPESPTLQADSLPSDLPGKTEKKHPRWIRYRRQLIQFVQPVAFTWRWCSSVFVHSFLDVLLSLKSL